MRPCWFIHPLGTMNVSTEFNHLEFKPSVSMAFFGKVNKAAAL